MVVIVLIGLPGAGKEEFVKLAQKRGFQIVRMGDVVREYGVRKNIRPEKLSEFADKSRKKYGAAVWAYRTLPKLKSKNIVIDGCRSLAELAVFKSNLKDVNAVGIFAPPSIRYKRLVSRGRKNACLKKEVEARDKLELKWGLGNAFAVADYMLVNDSTLEKYRKQVVSFFKQLKKST